MYDPDTLAVGVLGKPHGVHGEISLRPFNAVGHPRSLASGAGVMAQLLRDGQTSTRRLRSCRPAGDHLLVAFEGIDSSDAARELTHAVVRVPRQVLPPLGPGEFYVEDLVGCAVESTGGQSLGAVTGTFWNGAHDVMSVGADEHEILIPVVPALLAEVDLGARRLRVIWEVADDDQP